MARLKREFAQLGVDMGGAADTSGANFANADRRRSRSTSRPPMKKARADPEADDSSKRKVPRDQSGLRPDDQVRRRRRRRRAEICCVILQNIHTRKKKKCEVDYC